MKRSTFGLGLVMVLALMCAVPAVSRAADMMDDHEKMMKKDDSMMGDMKNDSKAEVAISGFCPVCVIHGMMNKGSDNFTTEYNGKVYKFPGIEEQKAFVNNPEEFTKDVEMKFKEMGGK